MPTTFGDATPDFIFNKLTSHQITEEFTVKAANTIYKGQPVKMDPAGTIVPFVAADEDHLRIGESIHNGAAGERVTVLLKGHTIIAAQADGDTVCGPVKYTAYDTTTHRPKYSDSGVTGVLTQGWAIDSVLDGEVMRVITRQ